MEKTAPKAQVWTQLDAYGNAESARRPLARFLLLIPRTFHGQKLRETRAEIERQGFDRVPGRGSKTAPLGAPSPFLSFEEPSSTLDKIWRPAVSGTGGIQDDRVAGRQKPKIVSGSQFSLLVEGDIYPLRVNVE
jgi:hypothetical protein